MPTGLVRYQHTGNFHFVTFSCDRRQPLLATRSGYGIFEQELDMVRRRHGFVVAGYVVMPEHVHLLVSEPGSLQLCTVLQVLKQQVSRRLKQPGDLRFWQRRYYDFNVRSHDKKSRKTQVHAPQPSPPRSNRSTGRLALVQLPPLPHWRRRRRGNRVALDSVATRTPGNIRATHPSQSQGRVGHPVLW